MEITLADLREVCCASLRISAPRCAWHFAPGSSGRGLRGRHAVEILLCLTPSRSPLLSISLASLQGPSDEHPFSTIVMGEMFHAEKARGDAMRFSTPYQANADYVNRVQSKGMLIRHRRILVEWMMEFSDAFKLNPEVLPLAVNYFDRFLSIENLEKKKLHLLCMVVLFVASKTAEVHHIMMNELVDATGQVYGAHDVRELEKELLAKLSWKMQPVTAYQLLKYKLQFLRPTLRVHLAEHVEAFHDFGICEYELLALPPAVFADGVISAVLEFSMQPYEVRKEVCHQLCIKQTPYLWEIQLRLMKSFFSILRQSKPHAPILHAWEERITCWERMCVVLRPALPFFFSFCPSSRLSSSFLPAVTRLVVVVIIVVVVVVVVSLALAASSATTLRHLCSFRARASPIKSHPHHPSLPPATHSFAHPQKSIDRSRTGGTNWAIARLRCLCRWMAPCCARRRMTTSTRDG